MRKLLALVPLALTVSMLSVAPPAQADERVCRGSIGPRSIDGDVVVPRGATCRLGGTQVDGNVRVEGGATLVARGVRVGGNIQAENHRRVVVAKRDGTRSRVGGSVQLVQGGGGELRGVVVGSDIQLFSNDGGVRGERQPGRREPAVQVEPSPPHRWWERRPGQQGGPVPRTVTA